MSSSMPTPTGAQTGQSPATSTSRDSEQPKPYSQQPPEWRPPLDSHAIRQIVPDLCPTKPDQPEDDMSQASVRKGFTSRSNVQNEIFSAHEMIHERLGSRQTLSSLSSWFDEVLQRRYELDRRSIAPSSYKPPSRVTLNEGKLANYVKDLAESSVPLSRLSRNVPHGFRGEKLFEMLWAGGAVAPSTTMPASNGSASYFSPRTPITAATPSSAVNATSSSRITSRKSVEVSRAVWFIRALGAAELASLRNKSAATIIPEMTTNLCSWMAKQIAELNLIQVPESSSMAATAHSPDTSSLHPRTPGSSFTSRAGHSVPSTSSRLIPAAIISGPSREICAVLQSEVDEDRWIAKWKYSLSLARHLQAQQLLDRSGLVRWVIEAFAASNLVQLPFLLELVQEMLALIVQRRCFARPFLKAVLDQIKALDARFERRSGGDLRRKLLLFLRITCESNADALVSPQLWYEHSSNLVTVLQEMDAEMDVHASTNFVTSEYVEKHLRPRAERLLSKRANKQQLAASYLNHDFLPMSDLYRDIAALDSFDIKLIDQVFLSTQQSEDHQSRKNRTWLTDASWTPRVETILTWACSDRRCGIARQYLAATLIEKIRFGVSWDESNEGSDTVSVRVTEIEQYAKQTRRINVEPMLIKWLGEVELAFSSDTPSNTSNSPSSNGVSILATVQVSSIVILIGELARRGIFSYTKYLQRLIARGMTTTLPQDIDEISASEPTLSKDSLHLRLLRSLPLYDQPASVYQQRRQAIYGNRAKETYEEASERRAVRELKMFFPSLFDTSLAEASPSGFCDDDRDTTIKHDKENQLLEPLRRLWSASRYVRCKIFRNELLPACFTRLEAMSDQDLSRVAAVMERAEDLEALAQLLAGLLLRPLSDGLARATFNLIIAFSQVWRSMDIMCTFNQLVRQQLNHSSSIRNDKQAIMASTALLRLRTLIEGTPSRPVQNPSVSDVPNGDVLRDSVDAVRGSVDALLDVLSENKVLQHGQISEKLAGLRNLSSQSDSQIDESIERAIIESVLERQDPVLISPAATMIEQLYLEASLEIDERHSRWLSDLANRIEQLSMSSSSSSNNTRPLFALLIRLVAKGTLNIQIAVDSFVLPCLWSLVKKLTDPTMRNADAAPLLLDLLTFLSTLLAQTCDAEDGLSWSSSQALGAQATLLFADESLPSLLRIVGWLVCASDDTSTAEASQKADIEAFWRRVLGSDVMQGVFRQSPRRFVRTLKDACKQVWGCNPHRVADIVIGCLDRSSLLLKDSASITPLVIKEKLNGWDTSVVAMELVEVFERLQVVESSFQPRADSKTKTLAAGIFRDIFVSFPDIGTQFVRDCSSPALISKFIDVGLRSLSTAIAAEATAKEQQSDRSASVHTDDGAAVPIAIAALPTGETDVKPQSSLANEETSESTTHFHALARMCEDQHTLRFSATDSDACARILQHVVAKLEKVVVSEQDIRPQSIASLVQSSTTLDLLHLILRFNCLWTGAMKVLVGRLVKAILQIAREAGKSAELGALFIALIDTSGYVLDEIPGSLLGIGVSETEEIMHGVDLASAQRTERFQRLSFDLESAVGDKDSFTACSADAALKRGWYAPGGPSPWECPEYLESSLNATRPPRAGWTSGPNSSETPAASGDSKESISLPSARLGWPTKLALNTALPLSLLGVRVTRDLIPDYATPASSGIISVDSVEGATRDGDGNAGLGKIPERTASDLDKDTEANVPLQPFLESERTYGELTAGETVFARSLRRGTELSESSAMLNLDRKNGDLTLDSSLYKNLYQPEDVLSDIAAPAGHSGNTVIDFTWDDEDADQNRQPKAPPSGNNIYSGRTHLRDGETSSAPNAKKRRLSKQ